MFTSFESLLTSIIQIYIYFVGGLGILRGEFTIGMFTIFLSYFTLLLESIKYFYKFGNQYQNKIVSYDRLKEILDIMEESNGNVLLDNIEKISIKKLLFKYNNRPQNIFKDFSLELKKGSIYCIVGGNGSGKSTLLDIMAGMYIEEKKGIIEFNDINIKDINMIQTRKTLISYSDQMSELISDTIKYNILLEDREFTNLEKKEIQELELIINFKDFLLSLPCGYNTVIDDIISNLSGGEKKKISLLRSFLKKSNILLLDEPTTWLDQNSINKLKEYLLNIKTDKIIVIVTHDKEIIGISDKIYYLN